MNVIDIVCLVLVFFFTMLGVWHGFLRGIFRLVAWAGAIAGAYFANKFLFDTVADLLQASRFSTSLVCICIGFLPPFLLFLFISHMVNKAINGTVAGRVDRFLGGAFGAVKALLICFVLLTILHILPFGGVLHEKRDSAMAYSAYKCALKLFGYSIEPVDLVGVAERKASEFTQSLTNKASEKATEIATEASEKAGEVAKEAVKEATDRVSEAAQNASPSAVQEALSSAKEKTIDKVQAVKESVYR